MGELLAPKLLNSLLVLRAADIAAGVNHSGVADRNAERLVRKYLMREYLGRREE